MAEPVVSGPVLVWGGGAIGGTLAAYWSRAGVPVLMVDVEAEHVRVSAAEGLAVEGPVETFRQAVPAVTPDRLEGRFDRIVLAVKAQATETATRMLAPHLAEDGFVLSAQNGLNERAIAAIVGPERTMGCFVNFGADWFGPGRILFGNRGAVVVGEIDGSIRERTRAMFELLRVFEPGAVLTDDIWSYLWGKMGYGAMLFATALTNDSMTENFADPARAPALIGLAREVCALAAAEGVSPRGFNGYDPAAFAPGAPEAEARACLARLADFNSRTAKTHTGIWRDLAVRRRKTEVDAQIGVMVGIAEARGVAAPLIARLVELVHDVEEGRRPMAPETFHALTAAS